jgi:hypothetical protein
MKGTEIFKWGLGLWLGYEILKEVNSSSQTSSNNLNPSPRNILTNLDIKSILEEAFNKTFGKPTILEPQPQPVKPAPDSQTVEVGNWLKLIHHPSVIVILGGRGKGKSALAYRLLEYLRWTASPYVVGLPENARKLLPDWVGMAASLEDVPPKAIVLVDEAYMPYHARSSMVADAKAMSQLVNLSRQRDQTLIFVSQEARQVDRNWTAPLL